MSNGASGAHRNIKQVMRTALVGVSPADKVMLKGYLRILLRLEADLEWVAADHPQADLLFINNEFRQANSVQKLLTTYPDKAVLFIDKSDTGDGHLQGDTLTLPLNKLTELSDWLMTNVVVLGAKDKPRVTKQNANQGSNNTAGASDTTNSSSKHTADKINAFNKNPNNVSGTSLPNEQVSASQQPATSSHDVKNDLSKLLNLIKIIGERQEGLYALHAKGERIALLEPETQRIWLESISHGLDESWQLVSTSDKLPTTPARDAFQWLWQQGMKHSEVLMPFVSDATEYQLRFWPKPVNKSTRRDVLKVMTALEFAPRTVSDVATIAETSVNSVKKAVAGLLMCGALPKHIYEGLSLSTTNGSQAKISSVQATNPPKSSGSTLDDVLARRASGQAVAMPAPSTVEIDFNKGTVTPVAETTPVVAPKDEKRGFLSKLRAKLGL